MHWILPSAYALLTLAQLGLMVLNLQHTQRHGSEVPGPLRGLLDPSTMAKSQRYTVDKLRFGIFRSLVSALALGGLVFSGGLHAYDHWIGSLGFGFIAQGTLFFLGILWAASAFEIPFSLYASFKLEAKHGFNRMTPSLFWADAAKGAMLGSLLTALLASGALGLVRIAPGSWWIWAFVGYSLFSVLLVLIAPYVIEPLFNKMTPLRVEGLQDEIRALAVRAGVQISQVLEVDASRRSSHSNAYFTGLGRVKRVVLFDTLRGQLSQQEILAILAHELGHWKLRHVTKRFAVSQLLAAGTLFLVFALVDSAGVAPLLWLQDLSFPGRIAMLAFGFSLVSFPLTPLFSYWSRTQEWQADRFAATITHNPQALASALTKLARDNLSNLHAHPLFQAIFYSHPPATARIARWQQAEP